MHPKISNVLIGLVVVAGLLGLMFYRTTPQSENPAQAETIVRNQVSLFGQNLKMVPLLAGTTTIARAMDQNYGMYVAPELLTAWENDPTHAPGRLTSSPSPDRIEISSIVRDQNGAYIVTGNVIEITSADVEGTNSGSYPVRLILENRNNSWLITDFRGYPATR